MGGGFALGAKLCRPDSDVWIIYGDGSLGYSVAEFDTFTRHKVKFLVFAMFYFYLNSHKEDWIICLLSAYKCHKLSIAYELT